MKKLLDTSYFSSMMGYYPSNNHKFNFVWEKLKEKIRNNEILIIDKVFKELGEMNDNEFVKAFLLEFKEYKVKTDEEDNVEVVIKYEQNKEKFKGSFDNFSDSDSADLSLIGKANKIKSKIPKRTLLNSSQINQTNKTNVIILTDEIMPKRHQGTKKVKLNIPSLAELFGIECKELKDSINIIIE